jgi:serine/threonine protein kinase
MENSNAICAPAAKPALNASANHSRFGKGLSMDALNSSDRLESSSRAAALPPDQLEIGEVLDDRFKILDVINRGGMAWIYKALDSQTGKVVAVKVPFLQFESDPGFYSRFQREENIGLTLDHPAVLKILPAGTEKSRPYIVMEYLNGETLAARMRKVTSLTEAEAVRLAIRICEGLDYLHRKGVVHRDLKPENIMLCDDASIRIMDFGIAKSENCRRLTFGGFSATMGTPDYIAPEQVQGKRGDSRSDIYALGAMLYEMTTGTPPYEGDNVYVVMNARLSGDPEAPRNRNPQLSAQIEEIILHALERNPAKRFPSAAAMKAELADYSEVTLTDRFKKLRPPQLWKARLPLFPKLAAIVLVQVVAFFLIFLWLNHRHHHSIPAPANSPTAVNSSLATQVK